MGVDAKYKTDREHSLDRAGDVHPGCRRFEPGGDEKVERGGDRELGDDMRDEEGAADDAQDIEFIQEIEVIGDRHIAPSCFPCAQSSFPPRSRPSLRSARTAAIRY